MSKTSAIREELVTASGLAAVRGEADQDFKVRLVAAVGELNDAAWEALSAEAQDWFNDSADNLNSKKSPIEFPDLKDAPVAAGRRGTTAAAPAAAAPAATSRRGATKVDAPEDSDIPVVGDTLIVTNKRGKVVEGVLLECNAELLVLDVGGEEVEFTRDRVESVVKKASGVVAQGGEPAYEPALDDVVVITNKRGKVVEGTIVEITDELIVIETGTGEQEFDKDRIETIVLVGGAEAEPEDKPYEPTLKDVVTIINKRNKSFTGTIVELDVELIILDIDGKEQEFPRDRIESITPVEAKVPAAATAKTSTRGSAKPEVAKPEGKEKKVGTTSNGGVSVTTRAKELILDNPGIEKESLYKMLTKEGLAFKEVTVEIIHKDVNRILDMMRERKLIK